MALCPIYDTLGADSVEFILQQTEMKCRVCTPSETLKVHYFLILLFIMQLLVLIENTPDLKVIVQIGDIDENTRKIAAEHVCLILSLIMNRMFV